MRYLFSVTIFVFLLCSCDHVENPYPTQVSIDLDTNLYPGLWSDYESNEWPLFETNPNTLVFTNAPNVSNPGTLEVR